MRKHIGTRIITMLIALLLIFLGQSVASKYVSDQALNGLREINSSYMKILFLR